MDVSAVNPPSAASTAIAGLQKAQDILGQAADSIASGSMDPQDVVALSQAATNFKVNIAVLKASDQMSKALLSMLDVKA
jgi:hypothetical protein